MTLFDYAVLTIVGFSVLLSVMRGFVREVFALAGWVIAFLAASLLSGRVAEWLAPVIANDLGRTLAAFVGVFVAALVAMSLIALALSGLIRKAGLGLEDRLLGGFFGFARGVLIVLVLVILAGLTAAPRQPAWHDAMLSPALEWMAAKAKPWLPQVLSSNLSYD
jgi:membrane protein required for colicin V production